MKTHTTIRTTTTMLALLALSLIVPSVSGAADAPDRVVFPTGEVSTDVQNVQAALDAGGTIRLKATNVSGMPTPFNFGTAAGVFISRDVAILGETHHSDMTTIHGGVLPIRGFVPVQSKIRGIHFHEPRGTAVLIAASTGLTIDGNKITHSIGIPVGGFTQAAGIHVEGDGKGAIAGTVLIKDNVIDQVDGEKGNGIEVLLLDAEARVTGNEIRGVNTNGILVSGNTRPVWIEHNLVVPGPERFPNVSAGNGISVTNLFALQPQAPVYIRHNTVICDNPFADGIALFQMDGMLITKNRVVMHNVLFGGISLYEDISNTYVGQNRVEGAGAYALDVVFFGLGKSINQSNTFKGNNISTFQSTIADVFLDFSGTVIDLDVDNPITGFSNSGADRASGDQISEAKKRKRELLLTSHSVEWPVNQ